MRTYPKSGFVQPTALEMKTAANRAGVPAYSQEFAKDLINIFSGGGYNSQEQMIENLSKRYSDVVYLEGGECYLNGKLVRDKYKNPITNVNEAVDELTIRRLQYHLRVQEFLQRLDLKSTIGNSPLEKAMNVLKLLSMQTTVSGDGTEDGDTLPVFAEGNPSKMAKRINEAMTCLENMSEEERELLDDETDPIEPLDMAKDFIGDRGRAIMLRISRLLDEFSKLEIQRSTQLEVDPDGSDIRYRPIRDLAEIDRLHTGEWIYPQRYRNYRLVTGQSPVRERVKRVEKKQLIYFLVDGSGSMGEGDRFYKAGGILMNRLQGVIRGDAALYFSFFSNSLHREYECLTPEAAKAAIERVILSNYDGGGTNIPYCVRTVVERIRERMAADSSFTKPEIVVVSDGECGINLKLEELHNIRLHTFLIDEAKNPVIAREREKLMKLSRDSGGVAVDNL